MRILVTAGNTQTAIDQVRCITNIFSGRTGTQIALEAHDRGHEVCLLTSHPELAKVASLGCRFACDRWRVCPYRTFSDLRRLMEQEITGGAYDAVIHVAAVSDYEVAGTYALPPDAVFDADDRTLRGRSQPIQCVDVGAGKVKGNHREVWLRLVPTPKLVDLIREPWGFRGTLVKFKLEVGVCDTTLVRIADESRQHSQADMIVANTLEGMAAWALLGTDEGFVRIAREELPSRVVQSLAVPC